MEQGGAHVHTRLLDQVRAAIRVRRYNRRTEDTYVHWIRRFILLDAKRRHPTEMGEREITAFLTYLAVDKNVAASKQNQALSTLPYCLLNESTEGRSISRTVRGSEPRLHGPVF